MDKKQKPNSGIGSFLGTALIGLGGIAVGFIASQLLDESSQKKQSVPQNQNNQQQRPQEKQIIQHEVTFKDDSLNDNLFCPITYTLMTEPYIIKECGHSFQKDAIDDWVGKNENCPLCHKRCMKQDLIPNYALKAYIDDVQKKQEESFGNKLKHTQN